MNDITKDWRIMKSHLNNMYGSVCQLPVFKTIIIHNHRDWIFIYPSTLECTKILRVEFVYKRLSLSFIHRFYIRSEFLTTQNILEECEKIEQTTTVALYNTDESYMKKRYIGRNLRNDTAGCNNYYAWSWGSWLMCAFV